MSKTKENIYPIKNCTYPWIEPKDEAGWDLRVNMCLSRNYSYVYQTPNKPKMVAINPDYYN